MCQTFTPPPFSPTSSYNPRNGGCVDQLDATMAAMSFLRNIAFRVPKSFTQSPAQLLPRKTSRVCFTSASRFPEGHNADDSRRREYSPYNADEAVQEPGDMASDMAEKSKQKAEEMKVKAKDRAESAEEMAKDAKDRAAQTAYDAKEKVKEKAVDFKENTKDNAGSMADKAYEAKEKTKDAAGTMADKTMEYAHDAQEKSKEAADKTKGGTKKAAETVQGLGEKAKQTVQDAWGTAKETGQKIKETVVGKSDQEGKESVDDFIEDHVRKPAREHDEKVMDDDVVELRRQAQAGDHEDKKKY